jgi:large subunit ribosomal protein L7/L12
MALTKEEILDGIAALTVLELKELLDAFETKFGVTAAAPVAVAAGGGAAPAAAAEEKDEFSVVLKDKGGQPIQVIKVVRELTNLGLKEAKELVDAAPKPILEKISKADANAAKKKLEDVGATVDLA